MRILWEPNFFATWNSILHFPLHFSLLPSKVSIFINVDIYVSSKNSSNYFEDFGDVGISFRDRKIKTHRAISCSSKVDISLSLSPDAGYHFQESHRADPNLSRRVSVRTVYPISWETRPSRGITRWVEQRGAFPFVKVGNLVWSDGRASWERLVGVSRGPSPYGRLVNSLV